MHLVDIMEECKMIQLFMSVKVEGAQMPMMNSLTSSYRARRRTTVGNDKNAG